MRRFVALATACVGLVVLGIGARPQEDASGALAIAWTWFGAESPVAERLLPATRGMTEFAAAFQSHRAVLHAAALVLSVALGLLTARWVRRAAGQSSAWFSIACVAVWFCALNPSIAHFVATREPLGAKNYLELEDAFRALGIGLFVVAAAVWRVPANSGRTSTGDPMRAAAAMESGGGSAAGARRVSLALAMLTAVVLPGILSSVVLDREPLTNDEHAYLFQARVFARGELTYDARGLVEFFPARQIAQSGQALFSKYPPAHSALLALGQAIGVPELVPRLLACLTVLLTWDLARRAGAARPTWAAWLLALSPLWIGVQSLWLSHSTSIPCCALLAWSAFASIDCARSGHSAKSCALAALGGVAFSIALGARPVTALAVAAPLVLMLAIERPRGWLRVAGAGAVGAVPAVVALLWINQTLTGSPFRFAYEMYAQASSPEDRFGNVSVAGALHNTGFNASRLSIWCTGWIPGLSLPLVALAFAPALRRRWVLAAVPATLLLAYALHPFQGIPWVGPLYVSEGLPELAILGAEGLCVASAWLGRGFARAVWVATIAASAVLLANHFAQGRREIDSRRDAFRAVHERGIQRGVVFVRYANAAVAKRFPLLPPEPESELVFARDLGPRNAELLRARDATEAWTFDPSSGVLRRWP